MDLGRRELFIASGAFAAVAATSGIVSAMDEHAGAHSSAGASAKAMADSSFDCVRTAQGGIKHCLAELGKGNKELALCAEKMDELMSITTAMGVLSSFASAYSKDLAPLVIKVCEDTDKECRKFPNHKECTECGDACRKCIEECKKMLSA